MQTLDLMRVTLAIELPHLGDRISKLVDASEKTPTEIAAEAGMSSANLYRIMSEQNKSVPISALLRIGKALGTDEFANLVKGQIESMVKELG